MAGTGSWGLQILGVTFALACMMPLPFTALTTRASGPLRHHVCLDSNAKRCMLATVAELQ